MDPFDDLHPRVSTPPPPTNSTQEKRREEQKIINSHLLINQELFPVGFAIFRCSPSMAAIIPRSFQQSCRSLLFRTKSSQHGLLSPCIWQQKRWNPDHRSVGGGNDYQFGPSSDLQPQPATQKWGYVEDMAAPGGNQTGGGIRSSAMFHGSSDNGNGGGSGGGGGKPPPKGEDKKHKLKGTAWKIFESAATTGASLAILGYGNSL